LSIGYLRTKTSFITGRELPSTNRHWVDDMKLVIDVYSDCTLDVANELVGTFDLSLYLLAAKGVNMGTYFVSMPAVLVISGSGKVISKYVASSPGTSL
jgi:hypothetical protein